MSFVIIGGNLNSLMKKLYRKIFGEKSRLRINRLVRKINGLFLFGNKVECNCCGNTYRKFLPKGNVTLRENVMCPNCGSLERTRLLMMYLNNETDCFELGKKVLHFAPEDGLKMNFIKVKSKNDYVNGDINPNYADEVIDITHIQYPDNYFDYIICSHVLGHVPDEETAIEELYRVLKFEGKAIIMTLLNQENLPTIEKFKITDPEERIKLYGERSLCRLHGNDFKKRLEAPGFKVEILDYSKKLTNEIVERFRVNEPSRGQLFICTK